MELGLRLAGFPYVVFYYDASPWAQIFSIPSIAHGLKQPASLAAGVVCQSPDDPMVPTCWRDLQASKPAKPLELAHGSATQSQRRERPSVPSPPPCFLVSRLAGTPNLAWYCTDFVDLDPTERASEPCWSDTLAQHSTHPPSHGFLVQALHCPTPPPCCIRPYPQNTGLILALRHYFPPTLLRLWNPPVEAPPVRPV